MYNKPISVFYFASILGAALLAPGVLAEETQIPFVFKENTSAKAAEVNSNFSALKSAVDKRLPLSGGEVNGDLAVTGQTHLDGNLSVNGAINGLQMGRPIGIPLFIGGISAGKSTGTYTGAVGFPFEFQAPPVVVLSPGEPDASGATHCHISLRGLSRIGWGCWGYNNATAADTVSWIAMEEGIFTVPTQGGETRKIMSGVFDPAANGNCSPCTINFPETFGVDPIIFVTVDESMDNDGPTSAKVFSFNKTAMTIATTHSNAGVAAYKIHWIAVEPADTDPIVFGSRLLYIGRNEVIANSGTITFPQPIPLYASLVATMEGSSATTSIRITSAAPSNTGFTYQYYTDTAPGPNGVTNAMRINWMVWVDQ